MFAAVRSQIGARRPEGPSRGQGGGRPKEPTLESAQRHALSTRSERHTIFDPDHLKRNPYIPITLGTSYALQLLVALLPPARRLLGLSRLGLADWAVTAACTLAPFTTNELIKLATRESS